MSEGLEIFRLAGDMARHAGARQSVIAQNVANADTPGYAGRTMPRFAEVMKGDPVQTMRATRPEHFGGHAAVPGQGLTQAVAEPAPNGNTVSIEEEMLAAIDASREHGRALAIYRHGLTIMRNAMGRT